MGVAVGTGGFYCYNEFIKTGEATKAVNKAKKDVSKKIQNMME